MSRPSTDIALHVSYRLLEARKQAGITAVRAAQAVGVHFNQIRRYEDGTYRVTVGLLAEFAALYNKPVRWFFVNAPGVHHLAG
jgi:transcriptional regulator with XRE-family HTH domain